jgi:hypothetical protein
MAVNALGACVTGVAFAVILTAKFTEGAWVTLLVIPAVILLLRAIRRYYDGLTAQIREDAPLDLSDVTPPVVLVITEEWSRLTDKAIQFALRLSPDVIAVHMVALQGPQNDAKEKALQDQWARFVEAPARAAGLAPPRLLLMQAPYRRMHEPLLALVRRLEQEHAGRPIAVLIPEIVKLSWWQFVLHTHRARRLRAWLLQHGGEKAMVINVPWYLEPPEAPLHVQ